MNFFNLANIICQIYKAKTLPLDVIERILMFADMCVINDFPRAHMAELIKYIHFSPVQAIISDQRVMEIRLSKDYALTSDDVERIIHHSVFDTNTSALADVIFENSSKYRNVSKEAWEEIFFNLIHICLNEKFELLVWILESIKIVLSRGEYVFRNSILGTENSVVWDYMHKQNLIDMYEYYRDAEIAVEYDGFPFMRWAERMDAGCMYFSRDYDKYCFDNY